MNINDYSIEELNIILDYIENSKLDSISDMVDELYTAIQIKSDDME